MSRRMVTGYERFDAMIGGGFPIGLTVFACDSPRALVVARKIRDAAMENEANGGMLCLHGAEHDTTPMAARLKALKARAVAVSVAITSKTGDASRDAMHAADVVLRVCDEGVTCAVAVVKPHPKRSVTVRFAGTGQDDVIWEVDVERDETETHDGPSSMESVRLAVATERARWVHAMEDVVDDLRHRQDACLSRHGDESGYAGQSRAYEIAADTLKAAITATMEEP